MKFLVNVVILGSWLITVWPLQSLGFIRNISVNAQGLAGNADSFVGGISANGRYISFYSFASNLMAGDNPMSLDVYVYDNWLKNLIYLPIIGNGDSDSPTLSAEGRYLVFSSSASNLVAGDNNQVADIFRYEWSTETLSRISLSSQGEEGNGNSSAPSISGDGRYIVFESTATNLVAGLKQAVPRIFVHDNFTGTIQLISLSVQGKPNDLEARRPMMSADGQFAVFESLAQLTAEDTFGYSNIYRYNLSTGETQLVSVDSTGQVAKRSAFAPRISGDGRYVVFESLWNDSLDEKSPPSSGVIMRDMQVVQSTEIIPPDSGIETGQTTSQVTISQNGRYLNFESAQPWLSEDGNGLVDVFRYDQQTQEVRRVNLDWQGLETTWGPFATGSAIAEQGCAIAFSSLDPKLVKGEDNQAFDVFVSQIVEQEVQFEMATGSLYLPTVQVPGLGLFEARLSLSSAEEMIFSLEQAILLDEGTVNGSCAHFALENGLLYLPSVEVLVEGGPLLYEVLLNLIPDREPLSFQLVKVIPH